MTPYTRHTAYTACATAKLSRVTENWQTDTAKNGKNSLHLTHSMLPKNAVEDYQHQF